uniref:Uncharacterized protein n=1 Tax=Candidatus Kentrum sp. LFY TaxID=2126342 RepID=A0A450U908_9GAMM|nr:MAG: hypothetical protein BECKLFY1418B_GA0070995_101052 [Candidatus Kentron sp. LFY]
MSKYNAKDFKVRPTATIRSNRWGIVLARRRMQLNTGYIGLDNHKDKIAMETAEPDRVEPYYKGEIADTPRRIAKLVARLNERYVGKVMLWCHEADRCEYALCHQRSPLPSAIFTPGNWIGGIQWCPSYVVSSRASWRGIVSAATSSSMFWLRVCMPNCRPVWIAE